MQSFPTVLELRALNEQLNIRYLPTTQAQVRVIKNADQELTVLGKIQKHSVFSQLTHWIILQAKAVLPLWLNQLSNETQLSFTGLSIRQQRTVWGSCSSLKRINLNYKLLFLPPNLVKHILLHELCHTQHFNHSKAFWNLLGSLDPDCQTHKKALKGAHLLLPPWVPMG